MLPCLPVRAPAVRNCVGRTHRQYGIASVERTGSTELRRSNAPAVRNCDGRGPVAFRKSGEKPHLPFSQWEDPESRLRLRTRRLEKALLLRCSDAEVDQDRARYNGVDHSGTVPAAHSGTVPTAQKRMTTWGPHGPRGDCPHCPIEASAVKRPHNPVDATPSARQIKNRPPHPAVAKQRGRDIPVA